MRIGIIGAGHIGGTLARLLVAAGHEVAIANSRGPETLDELVRALGDQACAVTPAEAARFGELVIVTIPFGRIEELPRELSVADLAGKIVIDTNNYYPQRDGSFGGLDEGRTTSSEMLRDVLGGALVVKAFNSLHAEWLRQRGRPRGARDRIAMPISGDDREAKRVVAQLVDQLGFEPIDAGGLSDGGRRHQPGTRAYGQAHPAEQLREELASP